MTKNSIVWKEGDFLKIELKDGSLCFGRVLNEPLIAFYDAKVTTAPAIDYISTLPILFKLWVMKHAVSSGHWQIIGSQQLEEKLKLPERFFKQDIITKKLCIYVNSQDIPATYEECKNLECAAVWEPEHVEDRLCDYYAGRKNKWVESLKIRT